MSLENINDTVDTIDYEPSDEASIHASYCGAHISHMWRKNGWSAVVYINTRLGWAVPAIGAKALK